MKILSIILLACLAAQAQVAILGNSQITGHVSIGTCISGPPVYGCSRADTAIVQTPNTAPFTGATGYNTIAYGDLNPTVDPILRATDSTMLGGHDINSSGSGGDNDQNWSCTGRTDTTAGCANASLYLLQVVQGGAGRVMGLKIVNGLPTVVAPLPASGGQPIPGAPSFAFSDQDPLVSFRVAANAGDPTIYKTTWAWDGTVGHSVTFSDASYIDLGANCPLPNGASFGMKYATPLSHDISDQVFFATFSNVAGIGNDTISVTNGLTAFTVSGPTPLATDGSLTYAIVNIAGVRYTIASITSTTTGTLTVPYAGTTGSGLTMNISGGQGTQIWVVLYNTTGPFCVVWNTYLGTTACSGTGCPGTGTLDSGCQQMYMHDALVDRDGIWAHLSGANSGVNCGITENFWQAGTLHDVGCSVVTTVSGNVVCGGHEANGYSKVSIEKISPDRSYYIVNPSAAGSATPLAPYSQTPNPVTATCDDHSGWGAAKAGDTMPIVGGSASQNYNTSSTTSTWTQPYMNEVYIQRMDGTLGRITHTYALGQPNGAGCLNTALGPFDNIANAYSAIGTESQDGRLWQWNSSMMGGLGTGACVAAHNCQSADAHTREDIFVVLLQ